VFPPIQDPIPPVQKPRPPHPGRRPAKPAAETVRPIRRPPPEERAEEAGAPPERVLRIAGLPAVAALFRHAPERVLRLFYEDRLVPEVGDFCSRLAKLHRPYRKVEGEELAKVAGTVLHGGIVAVAEPNPALPFDPAEARRWAAAHEPLVVLDGIGNPHNLGAIARTLAFFGFRRLVLSDHPGQAGLSDAAYRVAEGGLDCLAVYQAIGLPAALKKLKPDYRVVGTALARNGLPLEALRDDPRPVALVLGNEEAGLSRATLEACDAVVTLRGSGAVQSLNVSATAAILAYALRPRLRLTEQPRRPQAARGKPQERAGRPKPRPSR
jgi:TrmH RNA methyltransferase